MGEVGGLLGKAIVGTAKRVIDPRTGQPSLGGFLTGDNMRARTAIDFDSQQARRNAGLEFIQKTQVLGSNAAALGPEAMRSTAAGLRDVGGNAAAEDIRARENLDKRAKKGLGGGGGLGNMLEASRGASQLENAAGVGPQRIQAVVDAQSQLSKVIGPAAGKTAFVTTPQQLGQFATQEAGTQSGVKRTIAQEGRQEQANIRSGQRAEQTAIRSEGREEIRSDRELGLQAEKEVDVAGRIGVAKEARDLEAETTANKSSERTARAISTFLPEDSMVKKTIDSGKLEPGDPGWAKLEQAAKEEAVVSKTASGQLWAPKVVTDLETSLVLNTRRLADVDSFLKDFDENAFFGLKRVWDEFTGGAYKWTNGIANWGPEARARNTTVRSKLKMMSNTYIHDMTGAAMGNDEVDRYYEAIATDEDDPIAAYAKLQVMREHYSRQVALDKQLLLQGVTPDSPEYKQAMVILGTETGGALEVIAQASPDERAEMIFATSFLDDKRQGGQSTPTSSAPRSQSIDDYTPEQRIEEMETGGIQ